MLQLGGIVPKRDSGCFDIDLEAVTAAQPDYVFVDSGNPGLVKEDVAANPDYFTNLKAVEAGNVFSLVSHRFNATNVEQAIANCYYVGSCMYPDQFADIDSAKKLGEIANFFLGASLSEDLAKEGLSTKRTLLPVSRLKKLNAILPDNVQSLAHFHSSIA